MKLFVKLFLYFLLQIQTIKGCMRLPQGATGDRSPVDDKFQVLIEGNPHAYIPGQQYNISISCSNDVKLISFTLVVESELGGLNLPDDQLGHFQILDFAETRFSTLCANMIESSNTNTKSRVDVAWIAPENPESGCVLIRAAILQHRNVWFIDDGMLTKRICPEEIDDVNSRTPLLERCCACDEAKYELLLERKWTRNTHAKDFPTENWRTRFSSLIGASHTYDYRFWQYGKSASPGLEEMAEHGSSNTLEEEIKGNISEVRTIIKAPGINFRLNIQGTTLANVRVDPMHHVISVVTKIIPSPDWLLGVAGLELCLANCTWIEQKVLNLYPWDVGTDAGPSYMSPDAPQLPPDVVRRITSESPSDHRSPFYDESGAPMKPMGTLYITRKKLYQRDCEYDNGPLECQAHPWNDWSECTARCGTGVQYRVRAYKDQVLADNYGCNLNLTESQYCVGQQCFSPDNISYEPTQTAKCELQPWSEWSACSKACGRGKRMRSRDYVNPYNKIQCQRETRQKLEDFDQCLGNRCGGSISEPDNRNPQYQSNYGVNEDNGGPSSIGFGGYDNSQSNDFNNNEFGSNSNGFNNGFESNSNGNNNNNNNNDFGSNINGFNNDFGSNSNGFNNGFESNSNGNENRYDLQNGQNQLSNGPINSGGNRFKMTTRSPYTNKYANNQQNSNSNPIAGDIREEYDVNGHKTVLVSGTNPDEYDIVQEFCFEKPIAIAYEPCHVKKKIERNYWFYNADERECQIFTTDNCNRNSNKFQTLETCENTCMKPHLNAARKAGTYSDTEYYGQEQPQQSNVWNDPRNRGSRNYGR